MTLAPKKGLLDMLTQKIVESQIWRSIFRHGYPDTPLNQSLVMMGNVFLHYIPLLGDPAYKVLVGGGAVGQPALIRFYVLHVILLPLAGALLMAVHFWRIRKDGGVVGPPPQARRQ